MTAGLASMAVALAEMPASGCALCVSLGGDLVWHDERLRVIVANEPGYPTWTRVIWREHVAEITDLSDVDQAHLWSVVLRIERLMREVLQPHKVNLASFGNMVPHVHWHLIPRWPDDRHFPQPSWGPVQAADGGEARAQLQQAVRDRWMDALRAALAG